MAVRLELEIKFPPGGAVIAAVAPDESVQHAGVPPLTQRDRCDQRDCQVPAVVRVEITPDTYLDWCHHHFAELEITLVMAGYRILDCRAQLAESAR